MALRLLLTVAGVALIVAGVALAAHGAGSRGGRVVGAVALLGVVLIVVAWGGRR